MFVLDVNILIYAIGRSFSKHDLAVSRLEQLARQRSVVAIPDVVLSGVVRILSNPKLQSRPLSLQQIFKSIDELLAFPRFKLLRPGENHINLFRELLVENNVTGSAVSDAYIAAYALEQKATFISADSDFRRFKRLQWEPL